MNGRSRSAHTAAAETAGEKREEPGPRPNTRAAVLRKDFIVDAYQLLEARAHGADTTLLIVAILSDALLAELVAAARALGMEPLVEVNSVAELSRALAAGARPSTGGASGTGISKSGPSTSCNARGTRSTRPRDAMHHQQNQLVKTRAASARSTPAATRARAAARRTAR